MREGGPVVVDPDDAAFAIKVLWEALESAKTGEVRKL
jgi:hypothetical protein